MAERYHKPRARPTSRARLVDEHGHEDQGVAPHTRASSAASVTPARGLAATRARLTDVRAARVTRARKTASTLARSTGVRAASATSACRRAARWPTRARDARTAGRI